MPGHPDFFDRRYATSAGHGATAPRQNDSTESFLRTASRRGSSLPSHDAPQGSQNFPVGDSLTRLAQNAASRHKQILRQFAEGYLLILMKRVPGTCDVRAGRGGASFVEKLRIQPRHSAVPKSVSLY